MTIRVGRLQAAVDTPVEIDRVLMIAEGEQIIQGTPIIEGARVIAAYRGEGKARKIIIGKFKAKNRYARKNGHRQLFTTLAIQKILKPGEKMEEPPATPEPPQAQAEPVEPQPEPQAQPEPKPEVS